MQLGPCWIRLERSDISVVFLLALISGMESNLMNPQANTMVLLEECDILHVQPTKVGHFTWYLYLSVYFSGIFVQPSSLQKLPSAAPYSPERERRFRPINFPMLDTSIISSRVDTGTGVSFVKSSQCFFFVYFLKV